MAWVQRFFDGFKGSRFRVSERIITMITINLEFSKWPEMFKDATLVAALVDCLTYHSHILKETLIKSLSDFILGFLYRARRQGARIASYLRRMSTTLYIKIHMKSDSVI